MGSIGSLKRLVAIRCDRSHDLPFQAYRIADFRDVLPWDDSQSHNLLLCLGGLIPARDDQ
jgi:hypothetical protein